MSWYSKNIFWSMAQPFLLLYHFFKQRRFLFATILIAVLALSAYWAKQIHFEEDIAKMMPAGEAVDKLSFVLENVRFADKLMINIEETDTTEAQADALIDFAEKLVNQIEARFDSNYIDAITHKISDETMLGVYGTFYDNLPIFLKESDYAEISEKLTETAIQQTIAANFKSLMSPAGMALKKNILQDPLHFTPLALTHLQNLQFDDNYALHDGYILTKDKKHLLLFISSAHPNTESAHNSQLLAGLDHILDTLSVATGRQVKGSYFGTMAVSAGNAEQIKKDIQLTVSIALISLLLFISLFFRQKKAFFVIFLPALFGGVIALAILFFLKKEVSAISLGIGSVLLGISVDYALHIFTHYRSHHSKTQGIKDLASPILMSSITTATAFLCLLFVRSEALQDLGVFAAISVFLSALFSLIILPHLLGSPQNPSSPSGNWFAFIDRLAAHRFEQNRWIVGGVALMSFVCLFTFGKVGFESDMSAMNYVSPKLQAAEASLLAVNSHAYQSAYLITKGATLDEALRNTEKMSPLIDSLQQKQLIESYSGVDNVLLSAERQAAKIKDWQNFWTPERQEELKERLLAAASVYKFTPEAFAPFFDWLAKDFEPINAATTDQLQRLFFSEHISQKDTLVTVATLLKVKPQNKEQLYPIFAKNKEVVFFDRTQTTNALVKHIKTDFDLLVGLSLVVVFLILLVAYGRIELTVLTLIPLLLSWLWTLGIMELLGLKFNILNIIISTFIFGLGIDYGIFVMQGLLQEYKYGRKNLTAYKTSILLSAVTTITGIGVLIFAKHPALRSIALSAVIGIVSVVLITYTLAPLLAKKFFLGRKAQKTFPVTLGVLLKTIQAYALLMIGCFGLPIIALFLFPLIFIPLRIRKLIFHTLLMYWSRMYIFCLFPFRYKKLNAHGENFKKPAVLISNHQSLIDTPFMFSLYPKLIILTNDWVYNSVLFGPIARLADFYTVSNGIDKILPQLKDRIAEGYSIVVFPEGTRSKDFKMKRFHKGAFYLAEQLKLDIVPLYLHGTGHFLQKGDFWGRANSIVFKIFERITPTDQQFGTTYKQRAKQIKQFYLKNEVLLKKQYATPDYYRKQLISNYLYKGPVLEWYAKIKTAMDDNYRLFDQWLPKRGAIVDVGCGYGFMTYMLYLLSNERRITALDYDAEKIEVAQNCSLNNENIAFICGNIMEHEWQPSDGIVLSDVLHYLPPEQQRELLHNCMAALNKGGVMLVRDGDASLEKRHQGTRLTELFSTHFGFNQTMDATKQLYFFTEKNLLETLAPYDLAIQKIDTTQRTSNVVYVIKKRA